MSFDIGSPAIDRDLFLAGPRTAIAKENPASEDGVIEHVAIYAYGNMLDTEVAIFEQVAPNTFTTRSHQLIGFLAPGYSEHDVTLPCKAGDFIGFYCSSGQIERQNVGDGYWYVSGDFIPCTDKVFSFSAPRTISLWGWYTSPAVRHDRFRIEDIAFTQNCHTVTVVTQTDVTCHKYLRFTDKSPRKHPRTLLERGLLTQYDLRYCFVAYHDIEQEEAGDTLEHTFILENLIFCTGYFFYFWAKSGGTVMVYTSPIFAFRYPLGLPPYLTCERQETAVHNTGFCQYWNAQSQTFQVTHDYNVHHLSLMLNQHAGISRGPYCVKITRDIGPCWAEPLLAIDYGSSAALPAHNVKQWKSWWGIRPTLEVGKTYRIVVHTLPGWQYWNGEDWIDDEASAGIHWWMSSDTNPYPYGSAWYGCNIKEQSGSWIRHIDYDDTFRLYQLCPSLPS